MGEDADRCGHTDQAARAAAPSKMQRRRPRQAQLWVLALLASAAVVGGLWSTHKPAAAASANRANADGEVVPVQTAVATLQHDVPLYLTGLGTVQAFYTATMTARVNGEVMDVYFKEGQLVKKGQLLALIDPRPYKAALAQALATEAKDAAQLLSARQDLQKYLQLAPRNLSSKQQVDDQRALVAQLVAQVQMDQAAIDNARTNLAYCSITAPFEGRTGLRLIDPGNNVLNTNNTNGIVVVTKMQPISVVFVLPEKDLLRINQAMAATHCQSADGCVKVIAVSQDGQTQLDTGTLTVVDNQIDTTTGTMKMKATFPNLNNTLWPGEFVNAEVLVQQLHNVVTVPTAALQTGPDGPFLYVLKPDSTVEARPVTIGVQSGSSTVVNSGISVGEQVVTSNQFRLQPSSRVLVTSSAPVASGSQ